MKKACLIILIFLVNVLSSSAYLLNCTVEDGNSCPSGVKVLGLTSRENAHAYAPTKTSDYSICCNGIKGLATDGGAEGNETTFLRLSAETNAHVEKNSYSNYAYEANISMENTSSSISLANIVPSGPIDCIYDPSCAGGYTCLASISADTNAQIGNCSSYSTKICCRERCDESQCWNGSVCIDNQAEDPNLPPYRENFRCINGQWKESVLAYTWNRKAEGYCPDKKQCLVNPDGTYANNNDPSTYDYSDLDDPTAYDSNPQCINGYQYIADHFCENSEVGRWTTRTKLAALQLLNLTESSYAPNDYVLFCDEYDKVLNYFDYKIQVGLSNPQINDYFIKQTDGCEIEGADVPCVNKICVLKYKKDSDEYNVVFGASLNQPINALKFPFLESLNKPTSYCDAAFSYDNQSHSCSGDDNSEYDVWYNHGLLLVIYAKDEVKLAPLDFWERFNFFMKNPFQSIFNIIIEVIHPPPLGLDYDFINQTTNFDKIYLRTKGSKVIRGVTEKIADDEFLAINYTGFSEDICKSVDIYNQEIAYPYEISCNKSGSSYYVETKKFGDERKLLENWYGLTAKLRVS